MLFGVGGGKEGMLHNFVSSPDHNIPGVRAKASTGRGSVNFPFYFDVVLLLRQIKTVGLLANVASLIYHLLSMFSIAAS